MSKTKTPALTADQFDGTNLETLAFADGLGMAAIEAISVDMIQWYEAGMFPTVDAVKAALARGYARAEEQSAILAANGGTVVKFKAPGAATLAQYASGILKWSRAGKFPKGAQSPRAFTASIPGKKDPRGAKPGAKTETPETKTETPSGAKTETKTAEGKRLSWKDCTANLSALIAASTVMPTKDGGPTLSAADAAVVSDHLRAVLAVLSGYLK